MAIPTHSPSIRRRTSLRPTPTHAAAKPPVYRLFPSAMTRVICPLPHLWNSVETVTATIAEVEP